MSTEPWAIHFVLVDEIILCVDAELAALRKKLKPVMRLRILKAAYAMSAEKGRVEPGQMKELLAIAVHR